jgi:hypothetical protein
MTEPRLKPVSMAPELTYVLGKFGTAKEKILVAYQN